MVADVLLLAVAVMFFAIALVAGMTCAPSRRVPDRIEKKLAAMEPGFHRGPVVQHKVTAVLADGRRVDNVYIGYRRWLNLSFGLRPRVRAHEITDVEPSAPGTP
jgi:hypothetical protein